MKNHNELRRPQRLKRGDMVAVVAPAGAVDPEQLRKGLRFIESLGLRPRLGRALFSRCRYMAGTDAERARDLMEAFADPTVKGIFCARGGYGVNRVLPRLDAKVIRANPKIVVGASDITLLLIYLQQKCSLTAFHGPMVAGNFGRHPMPASKRQFRQLLFGDKKGSDLAARSARVLRPGTARAPVAGGCLTLLCRSLRTPWEIATRGKILLIEDVNEPPYRIDGMLWQLRRAGKFASVKGVVFGEMVNCRPPTGESWSLDDVIRDALAGTSFPVLANLPVGHGKEMWTLPLGVEAVLDTPARSLVFKHGGVV